MNGQAPIPRPHGDWPFAGSRPVAPLLCCALLCAAGVGSAQAPAPQSTVELVRKNIEALSQIKANNEELLKKQTALRTKLGEIQENARQLRLFAR